MYSRCRKAELAPCTHSAGLGFQQLEPAVAVLIKFAHKVPLGQRPSTKLVIVPTVDRAIGSHLLAKNGTPAPERCTACHYMLGIVLLTQPQIVSMGSGPRFLSWKCSCAVYPVKRPCVIFGSL